MTKYDIRVLSCIEMKIEENCKFLDIGAGTGSISIQAAKLGAIVTAIESKREAVELIWKNQKKFNLSFEVLEGFAPDLCPDDMFDSIFLGGNRGKLKEIIDYAHLHLRDKGILLCNFVTLENAANAKKLMKEKNFEVDFKLIQISQEDHLGILRGQNPIFMLKGVKK